MICRLCLKTLNDLEAIYLFQTNEANAETKVAKMIAKYFQLEITQNDTISTSICHDCFDHLEDFHKFWTYVDQQQSTLRNAEFLEVKCDVQANLDETVDRMHNNNIKEDELLFDLQDVIPMESSAGFEDEDVASTTQEFNFDTKEDLDAQLANEDTDSTDDDTPLVLLKSQSKKQKTSKIVKPRKKQTSKKSGVAKNATTAGPKKHEISKHYHDMISNFMQLSCDLCNSPMKDYNELRAHFKDIHNTTPYVKCCDKVFNKTFRLVTHINLHQNPEMFRCKICNKQLRDKKNLVIHMGIKHSDKEAPTYTCHICSKAYPHPKSLANHLVSHNERIYSCEMCEKSFPTVQRLRAHIQSIHEDSYPHVCDFCGKKFKNKHCFDKHIQLHQGVIEEPAQCNICGKWLKHKDSLRSHRVKHEEKDIKCPFCDRICQTKDALRGHVKYAHRLKNNLQCTFCEKTFKLAVNLEEHIATHTGIQLYTCPYCSWGNRSQSSMYSHVKRHHFEEWNKTKMTRSNISTFKTKLQ